MMRANVAQGDLGVGPALDGGGKGGAGEPKVVHASEVLIEVRSGWLRRPRGRYVGMGSWAGLYRSDSAGGARYYHRDAFAMPPLARYPAPAGVHQIKHEGFRGIARPHR
jgi:hypothetical protein